MSETYTEEELVSLLSRLNETADSVSSKMAALSAAQRVTLEKLASVAWSC